MRKGLTLSPGLRYEAQTHLDDYNAFGPRFGVTWAPFKNGKTTLRASAGVFYDWLNSGTYEQTLRVDGFRQQELNIINPTFPDPGAVGTIPPINKYLLADDLQMAKNSRVSLGVDHAFTPKVRAGVTYAHVNGAGLLRGLNMNAPIDGVRPDPLFGNIVEVVGDAGMRRHPSIRSCRSRSRRRRRIRAGSSGTGSAPTSASTTTGDACGTTPTARSACRRRAASRPNGGRAATTSAIG